MKRFKGCLGVFLIFFLGAVFGALLASGAIYAKVWALIEAGPETVTEFTVQRLRDELKLDTLQKREFQRIADRTRLQLRALRYRAQPEVDEIVNAADADLRAILNPKQQKKLDEVMNRFRDRWRAEAVESQRDGSPEKIEVAPSATPENTEPGAQAARG